MEQNRILAAIVLSFLVFLVWELVVVDKTPKKPSRQEQISQNEEKTQVQPAPERENIQPAPVGLPKNETIPDRAARTIVIDTPLYQARISEHGAVLTGFQLKKYRQDVGAHSPLLEMVDRTAGFGTLSLSFEKNAAEDLANARFVASDDHDELSVVEAPKTLAFIRTYDSGLTIEKRFIFSPDRYVIDLQVSVINRSPTPFQDSLILTLSKSIPEKEASYGFEGPSALIDRKLEQIKIKKIKGESTFNGHIDWIAYGDRYFISSVLPDHPENGTFRLVQKGPRILENQYVRPKADFPAGSRKDYSYSIYLGPKDSSILKAVGRNLDRAVHFGFFDFIAKPCVWLMNRIYKIVPNYGVAIILLTILIKLILWPLGSKSYKAMNEMKKIQPLMAEIKEKYKDDKKKMNEETMGLYRTYKVNPMGGCLPMLVQIPVFFALYRMLYEAIELRQAPFVGWIDDLSAPDRLFHFDFAIPFMQPPFGIPVLTLIMGATMFLQQKMSPPIGDPSQAKIMMLMPIFFTVIFINFSSGLVLYWLVNNVLSIAQQYYIQKKFA